MCYSKPVLTKSFHMDFLLMWSPLSEPGIRMAQQVIESALGQWGQPLDTWILHNTREWSHSDVEIDKIQASWNRFKEIKI